MNKRPTVKHATDALFDYRVPALNALRLYRHARGSRFGDAITHFTLHCAGVCRMAAEEDAAMEQWEIDGGAGRTGR